MAKQQPALKEILNTLIVNQIIVIFITLILYLYGGVQPFLGVLVVSIIYSNCCGWGVHLLSYLCRLRLRDNRPWHVAYMAKAVVVFFLGMTMGMEVGNVIASAWLNHIMIHFFSLLHLFIVLMNLGAAIIVVLILALYRNMKYNLERRNREYMELENLQIRTQQAVLQAKLNPHFLFNTLNVILDLAAKAPDKIEPVVLNLSDIYRTVLNQSGKQFGTLGDEVALVRKYLAIEKIRLEERLAFRIDWDESLAAVLLPPLLIQPLVENAVIHGISPKKAGGGIRVHIRREGARLLLEIIDDGVGVAGDQVRDGFGLHSVRERLRLLYGDRARMEIVRPPAGGTRMLLEVPLEFENLVSGR